MVRKSSWVLEMACALLKDSVVFQFPHAGALRSLCGMVGSACYILAMTGPASLQWWLADMRDSPLHLVQNILYMLSAAVGWRSEVGKSDFCCFRV